MSFIVDALKKSETDRQQRAAPGIADVPVSQPRQTSSRWLPIVIILLAINFVGVLYIVLRPAPPTIAAPAAQQTTPAPAIAVGSQPPPVAESAENAVERAPAAMAEETVETEFDAAAETSASALTAAPSTVTAAEPPPAEPAPASNTGSYLTINDLRASGSFNVPEMHIDLHVFSNEPAERFVFINMNQYRENATTEEGPRVREITTEGVVLDYQGSTFLLPRE